MVVLHAPKAQNKYGSASRSEGTGKVFDPQAGQG